MKSLNDQIHSLVRRDVILVIIVGLLLLLSVILLKEEINSLLIAEQPSTVPAASPVVSQTPAPAPVLASTAADASTTDAFQAMLNDPRNFHVVPADIRPAQAFIEGKTVQFLMGM